MGRSLIPAAALLVLCSACATKLPRMPVGAAEAAASRPQTPADRVRVFRSDQVPAELPDLVPIARYNLAQQIRQGRSTVAKITERAAADGADIVIVETGMAKAGGGASMFPLFGFAGWGSSAYLRTVGSGLAFVLAPSRLPASFVFPDTITAIETGAAADNVLPGDRILAMNGVAVESGDGALDSPHHAERLRIQPGQRVELSLLRPGVGIVTGSLEAATNPPTHLDHPTWDGSLRGSD